MEGPAFSSSQVSGIRCSVGSSRIAPRGWEGPAGAAAKIVGGVEGRKVQRRKVQRRKEKRRQMKRRSVPLFPPLPPFPLPPLPPLPGFPELRVPVPDGLAGAIPYGNCCPDDDAKLLNCSGMGEPGQHFIAGLMVALLCVLALLVVAVAGGLPDVLLPIL